MAHGTATPGADREQRRVAAGCFEIVFLCKKT